MNGNTGRSSSFITKIGEATARYIDRWSVYLKFHSLQWDAHCRSSHLIHFNHLATITLYHCCHQAPEPSSRSNKMSGISQYPRYPRVYLIEILSLTRPWDSTRERTSALIHAFYDPIYSYLSSSVPAEREITTSYSHPKHIPLRKFPLYTHLRQTPYLDSTPFLGVAFTRGSQCFCLISYYYHISYHRSYRPPTH